jgi:hypothetical protein
MAIHLAPELERITELCSKLRGLHGKHEYEQGHLDSLS